MTETIVEWLHANRDMVLVTVPTLAFMEALVGVGLLVSGAILLSVCTVLYIENLASLQQMLPLAFCGALVADHLGYYIGRWVGPAVHDTRLARRHSARIERASGYLDRFGGFAVVVGRLVTVARSLVPMLLGAGGMQRLRFTLYDLLACVVWTSGLGLLVSGFDALNG